MHQEDEIFCVILTNEVAGIFDTWPLIGNESDETGCTTFYELQTFKVQLTLLYEVKRLRIHWSSMRRPLKSQWILYILRNVALLMSNKDY